MPTTAFRIRSLLRLMPCFALAAGLAGQEMNLNRDLPSGNRLPGVSETYRSRQTHQIGGPRMGLVFSKDAGFRPILGIPGAALQGRSLGGVYGISTAVVPAGQEYALAIAASNRQPFLLRDLGNPHSVTLLPGTSPGADEIVMSPGGSAAVLLYREAAQVVILTGIPQAPASSWNIDAGMLPGPIVSLAVSDDGSVVLAAAGDENQQSVLLLAADQSWRLLTTVDGRASFAFLNSSTDALLADSASNQVLLVKNTSGNASLLPLAGEAEGISSPVAVAATVGNQRAIIANSDPGGIVSVSLDGGDVQAVACSCSPTGLHRLSGNAIFRLNEPSSAPLYVYDGDALNPRIVFVPPPARVSSNQGGRR